MPAQKQTHTLASRGNVNFDTAIKQHAKDETRSGFQTLPPNIKQGIARITKAYFSVYDTGEMKGKDYFRMEASIITPEYVTGPSGTPMKIRGRTTSVMVPMCDTKKADGTPVTANEHFGTLLNELRKAGIVTEKFTKSTDVDAAVALLAQGKTFIYFSTSPRKAQKDDPKAGVKKGDIVGTFENWEENKGLENYVPPPPTGGGMVDKGVGARTQVAGPVAASAAAPPAKPPTAGGPKPAAVASPPPPPVEPEQPEDLLGPDEQDLTTLGIIAAETHGEGDQITSTPRADEAQAKLLAMATAAGIPDEERDSIPTWQELAARIGGGSSGDVATESEVAGEGTEVPAEPEWAPEAQQVFGFHPLDSKSKQPAPNAVEVLVTAVDLAAKTCTLQNVKNKRVIYKAVPFTSLVDAPAA